MAAEIFTTAALTRREAGFLNNTDIDNTLDIEPNVKSANAEIEGCVGARYVVPLSDNTNYTGSSAESFLVELATQLASSELLLQQYEGQGGDLLRMADSKIKLIRKKLENLKAGKILLLDTEGVELALIAAALSAVSGFPLNSDFDDPDEPTIVNPAVTMNEKF